MDQRPAVEIEKVGREVAEEPGDAGRARAAPRRRPLPLPGERAAGDERQADEQVGQPVPRLVPGERRPTRRRQPSAIAAGQTRRPSAAHSGERARRAPRPRASRLRDEPARGRAREPRAVGGRLAARDEHDRRRLSPAARRSATAKPSRPGSWMSSSTTSGAQRARPAPAPRAVRRLADDREPLRLEQRASRRPGSRRDRRRSARSAARRDRRKPHMGAHRGQPQ